jgi:hypothetical protein
MPGPSRCPGYYSQPRYPVKSVRNQCVWLDQNCIIIFRVFYLNNSQLLFSFNPLLQFLVRFVLGAFNFTHPTLAIRRAQVRKSAGFGNLI